MTRQFLSRLSLLTGRRPYSSGKTPAKIMVSRCLLGEDVRYDGGNMDLNNELLKKYRSEGLVVPICPEVVGGLPTPRPGSEIRSGKTAEEVLQGKDPDARVISCEGDDVTKEYVKGARTAQKLAKKHHVKVAILKEDSPSCGKYFTFDGSHTDTLRDGMGITAAALTEMGVLLFNENEVVEALKAAGLPTTLSNTHEESDLPRSALNP